MILKETWQLMRKDLVLEMRQKHALGGIALYLVSTIFISYLAFQGIMNVQTWNALFWIIMVFASINLVLKSFQDESTGRKLYLYTLVSPVSVIFSKVFSNALIMTVLALAGFVVFSLFMGNVVANVPTFLVGLISGVVGFSGVLTIVSAIAGQTRNNFTLMAILGFPLVLPLLLVLIKVSAAAIAGASIISVLSDLLVIWLLMAVALTLSYILFPYLWKE